MVDLEILRERGITPESLAAKLNRDPMNFATGTEEDQKISALIHRIRSRIQEGMTRNFQDFRTYYALDLAWDTPFRQISPTLLSQFLDADPSSEEVYKQITAWGLTHLIYEETDAKSRKNVKRFNFPVFFRVLVPLVKAYVTIRWAKIMNDRRLTPFFKFEPVKNTTVTAAKCEAITDRIHVMSNQYGYFDVTKQAVLKMLHYSTCLQFPKEEWHFEEQLKYADETDVELKRLKDGSDELASVGDVIRVRTREGLRYHLPHPSRTYRDLAHPAYTYNYDYGCEYAGYWRIARYREILNSNFWNKERIALGTVDLVSGNRLFFTTVYSACTLTVPVMPDPASQPQGPQLGASFGLGTGSLDREKEIATLYYGTEHGDQGVLVSEHWEKLIPSENGLGDYDCPVWFRFTVAGDGCTILYAAPVPYNPIIYYGYDADEDRSKNASLSLEVLPFQDQFSNTLTQIILTAKQNLANITFVDEDQVTQASLDKLKNIGEKLFRFLNIETYSSKRAARAQNKLPEAVFTASLPKGNVAEMVNVLKTILDVLERVLVMSSNEVGQAASHEQTREEIRNIAANTSSRLVFTATPVDIARDAWKRQLYAGDMGYGDPEFYAHIPSETPLTPDQLEEMGFTFVEPPEKRSKADQYYHVRVDRKKTAVDLWTFAGTKDGEDRTDDKQTAVALGQIVQGLLNNPMTAQAIGPDQAIDLSNMICKLAGVLPRDIKLRNVTPPNATPDQQQQAAQQQLQQVVQTVMQQLQGELKPALDEIGLLNREVASIFRVLNIPLPHPANANGNPTTPPGGAGAPPVAPAAPVQGVPAATP